MRSKIDLINFSRSIFGVGNLNAKNISGKTFSLKLKIIKVLLTLDFVPSVLLFDLIFRLYRKFVFWIESLLWVEFFLILEAVWLGFVLSTSVDLKSDLDRFWLSARENLREDRFEFSKRFDFSVGRFSKVEFAGFWVETLTWFISREIFRISGSFDGFGVNFFDLSKYSIVFTSLDFFVSFV